MSDATTWRVTVNGGADCGWIVDIHDGTHNGVYSPEAATAEDAEREARAAHAARHWEHVLPVSGTPLPPEHQFDAPWPQELTAEQVAALEADLAAAKAKVEADMAALTAANQHPPQPAPANDAPPDPPAAA